MNEIGFRVGYKIVYYVVILNKNKSLRFVDLDNRDYITSMKVINAEG